MYFKKIETTNFLGEKTTEVLAFNLTEEQIFNLKEQGVDVRQKLYDIVGTTDADDAKDTVSKPMDFDKRQKLISLFKDFIDISYGELSADGKYFDKSPAVVNRFKSTQTYSDYFMMLATNNEEAAAFINGIMPNKVRDAIEAYTAGKTE